MTNVNTHNFNKCLTTLFVEFSQPSVNPFPLTECVTNSGFLFAPSFWFSSSTVDNWTDYRSSKTVSRFAFVKVTAANCVKTKSVSVTLRNKSNTSRRPRPLMAVSGRKFANRTVKCDCLWNCTVHNLASLNRGIGTLSHLKALE